MSQPTPPPDLRLRIVFEGRGMIGPGKADLLERIDAAGSIAAAGRQMGMSYRRAWQLVETMNAMFAAPVVESARGGARGGGAAVTETGREVLRAYRDALSAAEAAAAPEAERLRALLAAR